jgi:hypothetical protein
MAHRIALPALLAVAALLLAGCAGKAPAAAPQPAAGADADAGGAADGLAGRTSFDAPQWQRGQWWEWTTTFGTQTADFTYCSIVTGTDGSFYTVATENTDEAKTEATFGMPLLGAIGRADLSMDGWGGEGSWSLLSFPLADGKAWTATMPNIAWDSVAGPTVDLAMVAHVVQATGGGSPTVHIVGTSGNAQLMSGLYDPATGWFRDLDFYDTDPGEEGLEIGFHAKSAGTNYTGPYFVHTAKPLLRLNDGSGFTDDPTQGGEPFADPEPQGTFTMQAGTRLFGAVFAETVLGAREVALVPPQGEPRHAEVYDASLEGAGGGFVVDEPGVAGDWRVATGGAGGYSQAFVALYELTEGNFQM